MEEALDKRSSTGIVGNLQAYTQFQAANAMEDAASNPTGMAGGGMGMGMGFAMANQMGQNLAGQGPAQGPAPPPLPRSVEFYAAFDGKRAGPFDLAALKQSVQSGILTRETLVWTQGMENWAGAGQVEGLTALFEDAPPPLP